MFVELLGLPASGKSTLLNDVARHYKNAGVTLKSVGRIADQDRKIPGFIRRNAVPRAMFRLEQFRASYPDCVPLIDTICGAHLASKSLLLGTAVAYQSYQANRDAADIATADEGFLHRAIFHLAKAAEPTEILSKFCAAVPVPKAIFLLDLPGHDSFERAVVRLMDRDKTNSPEEKIRARIQKAHGDAAALELRRALMLQAADQMAARGAHVIRLDSRTPIAEVRNTAIAALDALRVES